MIKECKNQKDFDTIVKISQKTPVFLIKHSTACPISARAMENFKTFAANNRNAEFYRVLVIEDRPLSMGIAESTGVTHKSPQIILFKGGHAVWNESHNAITRERLYQELNSL
ncbi:MAG: bacillithiol system redox-active protein YtxJ [bacterium]